MTKLFQKKDEADLRSVRIPIRVTEKEAEKIRHSASIRQMDVSEFVRRAALGRKADVDYQTEIVLALSDSTRRIRELHAAVVATGVLAPEAEWLPVILDARAAILRITK